VTLVLSLEDSLKNDLHNTSTDGSKNYIKLIHEMLLEETNLKIKIVDTLTMDISKNVLSSYIHIWEAQPYVQKKLLIEFKQFISMSEYMNERT